MQHIVRLDKPINMRCFPKSTNISIIKKISLYFCNNSNESAQNKLKRIPHY
jgi:hypothetical protein